MQEFLTPGLNVSENLAESPGLSRPEVGRMGRRRGQGRFAACPLRLATGWREAEIGVCGGGRDAGGALALPPLEIEGGRWRCPRCGGKKQSVL